MMRGGSMMRACGAAGLLFVTCLLGCGEEASSSGGGGSGGQGGSGAGQPTSCAACTADQKCRECTSASGPPTISCIDKVADTATQFACGEIVLCDTGSQVCVADTPPVGDNCGTTYECGVLPSACSASPSCACITMYEPYQNAVCTELDDGAFELAVGAGT